MGLKDRWNRFWENEARELDNWCANQIREQWKKDVPELFED